MVDVYTETMCQMSFYMDVCIARFTTNKDIIKQTNTAVGCFSGRSENMLTTMWVDVTSDRGYFCREPGHKKVKFAFTNFGVSYALQSVGLWPERVDKVNAFFESYKSHDEYDTDAITHVMQLNSLLPGVFMASYKSVSG